ncbi:MAG TPA: hypothetical protein VMW01_03800 [Williamwhitmania sp.]|nr:hypothetical protein [Williamwhitmania sp.]
MKINAFRTIGLLLGVASSFLMSCSCERTSDNGANPTVTITNLTAGGDTALAPGQSITFELACSWNGSDALTNLIVSSNGVRLVDEGFFKQTYNKEVIFTKDTAEQNILIFTIRDKGGRASQVSYTINKAGGSVGEVQRFNGITIGAQQNTTYGSFMNLESGAIFTKDEAAAIPDKIHLLCYFDTIDADAMVIASPGSNVDASVYGDGGPTDWTIRNTARFLLISISADQFNALASVADLVSLYDESAGKRKAKNLAVGDIYSFKQEDLGLYGVFRVTAVDGQPSGLVTVDMVVQKTGSK